jgi:hypothetical protein
MWLALRQLLKAYETARQFNRAKWEFAVEIAALGTAGSDHNDLRALICQGLVEHAEEVTGRRGERRTFRRIPGLRLTPTSCFVLSDWGIRVSTHNSLDHPGPHMNGAPAGPPTSSPLPSWDAARRRLCLGQVVVKRFRQPAKNQEAILAAFEEDGWPPRIDSPIPGGADENAHDRLHDAVKRLNRQSKRLIRFECDGAGEGVLWHLATWSGACAGAP